MNVLRIIIVFIAAIMLGVSFVSDRELFQDNKILSVGFDISLILYIPLFFAAVVQFIAGIRNSLVGKELTNMVIPTLCLLFSLISMYAFNRWFFDVIF